MSSIIIKNLHNLHIKTKENAESLLKKIHGAHIDWMHACGGKGNCTSCKAIVVSGMQHLSPLTPKEERMCTLQRLKENERLTCQAVLEKGEVEIEVPKLYQLPHMEYDY